MKIVKQTLSVFLILLMLFTIIPIAYATDGANASIDNEASVSAENGLSKIIENLTEADDEYANTGYSISDMTFDGITANVTVNVPAECTLVVAVYDEDTLEMISSATKQLSASVYSEDYRKDVISVDMNMLEMPEYFLAKAFLLDENKNALCKNYTCRTYTAAFEVFMETTPDDFEGKDIVTMDNNCDDFGVLIDGAVAAKKSDTMTYTYDNGVYTFYNAIEEVKGLKTDDIFYYQLSDEIGDFLLIKVVSVDVNGSTVTIVEDDEIALGDAFQFVRIDEDADFSDIELTEDNLGSALSFQEPEMQVSTFSGRREIVVEESKSYSTSVNIKYPQDDPNKDDELDKGLEVEGSLTYTLTASVNLYYDARWGKDFYEFKTDLTHNVGFNITFSGKIELNKEAFKIGFSPIPLGILELDISVYPVVSAEASVKIWGAIDVFNRMSYTDSDGLTKINDTKWLDPDGDLGETEVEITIGLGVDFDIGFKKGKEDNEGLKTIHVSVAVSIEAGVKGTFVPSLVGNLLDKHHDCVVCLDGSLSMFVRGTATLKIKIVSKSTTVNWDAIDLSASVNMGRFYFSIGSHGVKLGFGTCPYISHKVTVTVYNSESGKPVLGAVVSTTTGYCDADGDGKFKENSMRTNEKGQVVFYFPKGQHEIIAKKDDIGIGGQKFEMLANEKELYIELFDAEYFDGHWYKVFEEKKTWEQAKEYCENMGGHLVTITSSVENNFVTTIFPKLNGAAYKLYYIGYSDIRSEGIWEWVTLENNTYSNWASYQPDNNDGGGHDQDATIIVSGRCDGIGKNGEWDDTYIGVGTYFICEWESIPKTAQAMSYRMSPRTSNDEDISDVETTVNGTTTSRNDALIGAEYVLTVIKDETAEDFFSNENLLYIDQKTADSSTVSFDFVLPEGVVDYTVKIFGVSHTHTPAGAVRENEVAAICTVGGNYDEVTYCSVCNVEISRNIIEIPATGHTFVGSECINCDYDKADNCDCRCHKDNFFAKLIWKIINFFNKFLRRNQECDCGLAHY